MDMNHVQGGNTEIKEVIANSHLFKPEVFLQNMGKYFFKFSLWGFVFGGQFGSGWRVPGKASIPILSSAPAAAGAATALIRSNKSQVDTITWDSLPARPG